MAITPCPIFNASESPKAAALIWLLVSAEISESCTAMIARSVAASVPFMAACTLLSSVNVTVRLSASLIT